MLKILTKFNEVECKKVENCYYNYYGIVIEPF